MEELPYFNAIVAKEDRYWANFKPYQLYQKVAKVSVTAIADTQTGGMATALVMAKEAITLLKKDKDKVDQRVFKLFSSAIQTACLHAFIDHQLFPHQKKNLATKVKQDLSLKISLSYASLINFDVEEVEGMAKVINSCKQWLLDAAHLEEDQAEQIVTSIKERLLDFLDMEWASNPDYYGLIASSLNTPFSEKRLQRGHLLRYYEELKQWFHQPALGDDLLPLSKIYQEPDFLVYKECFKEKRIGEEVEVKDGFYNLLNFDGSLNDCVAQWISGVNIPQLKEQHLLLLLGQPGQGKSSFCYQILTQLLEGVTSPPSVYFLRLRDLSTEAGLINEPFKVFEEHLNYQYHLKVDFRKSVLILDGLDELYMSGGITEADLKTFYKRLEHKAKAPSKVKVILTTRYNYLNLKAVNFNVTTVFKLAPMQLYKQQEWLSIYKEAHPDCILTLEKLEEINKEYNLKHIKELIEQPILLHLVAKSNVVIDASYNRATIYENLFNKIIRRKWDRDNGQLDKYQGITTTALRNWLQEIAFAIYSSDFECIHHHEIKELGSSIALNKILDTPKEMEDALKDLLVAFYFRNVASGQEGQAHPVEFLHKSLQEYLAAEYIWIKIIREVVSVNTPLSDLAILKLFSDFFANKSLNENLRLLLIEIINHADSTIKNTLRERLNKALPFCLTHQFLYIYQAEASRRQPMVQMSNCFKSFWLILAHLKVEDNVTLLEEVSRNDFTSLLQLFGVGNVLLSNLNLMGANLVDANLMGANLMGTNLIDANLMDANLIGANLMDANLMDANLIGANLMDANLMGTKLMFANLMGANLMDADLRGAKLRGAKLRGADLRDVDLRDANLRGVDLMGVDLRGANLMGADLMGANLMGADLRGANLRFANLGGVNLIGAYLSASKTNDLNLFQILKNQGCAGINELSQQYQVDPPQLYEEWDSQKVKPYYLITKHPSPKK